MTPIACSDKFALQPLPKHQNIIEPFTFWLQILCTLRISIIFIQKTIFGVFWGRDESLEEVKNLDSATYKALSKHIKRSSLILPR